MLCVCLLHWLSIYKLMICVQNLGASSGSWALSKTGKKSAGDSEGFAPFSDKLLTGDVIGCEADMNEGVVRFWRNGVNLGVAFTGLAGRGYCLVPAICIGSNSGGKTSGVTLVEFAQEWVPAA
jgi:Kip1 ubiquitination-promoting complex protein 1